MEQLPGLPAAAFDKADPSPDSEFYAFPRLVTHIDDTAITTVTHVYRERLPPDAAVLDVMSSWVSHLPEEIGYRLVVGHGMNEEELAANPRLSRRFVQDLNREPTLPLDDAAFDATCLCVSVQYLQRPVEVFREVRRVLRPARRSSYRFPTDASRPRQWRSGFPFRLRNNSVWLPLTCSLRGSATSSARHRHRRELIRCGS